MRYSMSKGISHRFVLPNNSTILRWEADLISMTNSKYVHEYEIKLNIHDYKADFKKFKHHYLNGSIPNYYMPNYFWYATYDFEIEPPEYAGWFYINEQGVLRMKKKAPLLHKNKLLDTKINLALKGLSYRISNIYDVLYKIE